MQPVPYFGQWESRDFVSTILAEGPEIALVRDPLWQASGARSLDEYVTWASHVCGMACLKMILAARTGRIVPTLELARTCTTYGGYTVDSQTGDIKGLVYAPFVKFVAQEFDVQAEVMTHLDGVETARPAPPRAVLHRLRSPVDSLARSGAAAQGRPSRAGPGGRAPSESCSTTPRGTRPLHRKTRRSTPSSSIDSSQDGVSRFSRLNSADGDLTQLAQRTRHEARNSRSARRLHAGMDVETPLPRLGRE